MNKELKIVISITLAAIILSGLLTLVVVKFELLELVKGPIDFWLESGKTFYIFFILGVILDVILKIKTKIKSL